MKGNLQQGNIINSRLYCIYLNELLQKIEKVNDNDEIKDNWQKKKKKKI